MNFRRLCSTDLEVIRSVARDLANERKTHVGIIAHRVPAESAGLQDRLAMRLAGKDHELVYHLHIGPEEFSHFPEVVFPEVSA